MPNDHQPVPISEWYRGVGIHNQQTPARVFIVKKEVDAVMAMSDPAKLVTYAADYINPAEARLLAAAKCQALMDMAVDDRKERPKIHILAVKASVAGLDTTYWRNPWRHGSLLDGEVPGRPAVAREIVLTGADCGDDY